MKVNGQTLNYFSRRRFLWFFLRLEFLALMAVLGRAVCRPPTRRPAWPRPPEERMQETQVCPPVGPGFVHPLRSHLRSGSRSFWVLRTGMPPLTGNGDILRRHKHGGLLANARREDADPAAGVPSPVGSETLCRVLPASFHFPSVCSAPNFPSDVTEPRVLRRRHRAGANGSALNEWR